MSTSDSPTGTYALKPWFTRRLGRAEDALVAQGVAADRVTAAGVAASAAAGGALLLGGVASRWWWLAVAPLVLLRLAANALDGAVARRTGTARPAGAVWNEVADRVSDALLLGAAGLVTAPALGAGAIAAAHLCSLAGVLAQAHTGARDNGGPMGKADRVAVLGATATLAAVLATTWPLVAGLWVVTIGAVATAARRTARLRRALSRPPTSAAEPQLPGSSSACRDGGG